MSKKIEYPWVSFCISTFKRPDFLHQQLTSLLKQTFLYFEIIISDNDPAGSAEAVCNSMKDPRIRYFRNTENLGMIKSFNKSIDRSTTEYIVMVTDDDPVDVDFLSFAYSISKDNPGYGIYGGFERKNRAIGEIECIEKENFIPEILNWNKTTRILWSSCVLKKEIAMNVGKIPDYGSPHLADHALIALIGDRKGGVIVNKMYSSLTSHSTNYSKLNFQTYLSGCQGFYTVMRLNMQKENQREKFKTIDQHLKGWLISSIYSLKKYYSVVVADKAKMKEIESFERQILLLPYMKKNRGILLIKEVIFKIKLFLGFLKPVK
ncbi:MAG: glycosyltransferase family 2 protein [Sphingobacteriales bacterium]|nr:glycosyltransferase family 2 protein [Sphingobacteriales bacterium]OJY81898.1 MAG: hypothetical protein BGP14_03820 [Sphingobacteriales bacterium 44-15]